MQESTSYTKRNITVKFTHNRMDIIVKNKTPLLLHGNMVAKFVNDMRIYVHGYSRFRNTRYRIRNYFRRVFGDTREHTSQGSALDTKSDSPQLLFVSKKVNDVLSEFTIIKRSGISGQNLNLTPKEFFTLRSIIKQIYRHEYKQQLPPENL